VQALVTPDGQCIRCSNVYRGRTHDKAIFDKSGVADFLSYEENHQMRQKVIMGDLGYVGIARTCPNAVLPHKRARGGVLSDQQKSDHRTLSRDRILVENFFGRWKSLFGICGGKYRGDLKLLSQIIRSTIAMTNWYVGKHPLRRSHDEERIAETSSESGEIGEARELDDASDPSE
jgi:hypothetical protein